MEGSGGWKREEEGLRDTELGMEPPPPLVWKLRSDGVDGSRGKKPVGGGSGWKAAAAEEGKNGEEKLTGRERG